MPKFFVSQSNIDEKIIKIEKEDAKHIAVLRMKVGDSILVCDGAGNDFSCRIDSISKNEVLAEILESYPNVSEPDVKVTLFQGLPKSDKMELIIQKAVELGVFEIVPVMTSFSVVKLKDNADKKTNRWQKISEAAAIQSERGVIPVVREPIPFQEAVAQLKDLDTGYVAYEREVGNSATEVFGRCMKSNAKRVGIFIGPEGGFSAEEIQFCLQNGIQSVSLGKRILRTETAGFVAIVLLLSATGDF